MIRFILLILVTLNLFDGISQCGTSVPNGTPSIASNGTVNIASGQVRKGQNLNTVTITNYGTLFIESASSGTVIRNYGTVYIMSNPNLLTLHNYNQAYMQTTGAVRLFNYKNFVLCTNSGLNGSSSINNYSNGVVSAVSANSVVIDVAMGACNYGNFTNLIFTSMNNPLHNCGTMTNVVANPARVDNNCSTCGSPLPVELIDFTAEAVRQTVEINWSTASERNNDYFIIEKTTDGSHYELVAEIEGAGNSTMVRNYTYTDYTPSSGISYYRLTQVDFNGEREVFEPKSVNVAQMAVITNVYPNPATDSRINVVVAASGAVLINVYNIYGQLVKTQSIDSHAASATEQVELPEGGSAFFVELIQNNVVVGHHKVMVTK